MPGIVLEIGFTTKLHLDLSEGFLKDSNEFGSKREWGRFRDKIK